MRVAAVLVVWVAACSGQSSNVPVLPSELTYRDLGLFYIWSHDRSECPSQTTTPFTGTVLSPIGIEVTNLVPQDTINPLYRSGCNNLRASLLLDHSVAERIDQNDPRLTSAGGLQVKTLGDKGVVLKKDSQGTMTANDVTVIGGKSVPGGPAIYDLAGVLFDYRDQVHNAWEEALRNAPVIYDPWGRPIRRQ